MKVACYDVCIQLNGRRVFFLRVSLSLSRDACVLSSTIFAGIPYIYIPQEKMNSGEGVIYIHKTDGEERDRCFCQTTAGVIMYKSICLRDNNIRSYWNSSIAIIAIFGCFISYRRGKIIYVYWSYIIYLIIKVFFPFFVCFVTPFQAPKNKIK